MQEARKMRNESVKLRLFVFFTQMLNLGLFCAYDRHKVLLPILDHDGLGWSTDVVSDVLLENEHSRVQHRLLLLKIVVIGLDFRHVEPSCDVEVGLVIVVELHQTAKFEEEGVEGQRGVSQQSHIPQGV